MDSYDDDPRDDPEGAGPDAGDGEEQAPEPRTRTEGVRIIGADEAAAALDSGQAAGRRPEDVPRYGDVPEPPVVAGPPPAARFPLPDTVDPSQVLRPPLAHGSRPGGGPEGWDEDGPAGPALREHGGAAPELPHWTDPPTGEVPAVLAGPEDEDDYSAWSNLTRSGARWRDHPRDWDDAGFEGAGFGDADMAGAPMAGREAGGADIDLTDAEAAAAEAPTRPPVRHRWGRGRAAARTEAPARAGAAGTAPTTPPPAPGGTTRISSRTVPEPSEALGGFDDLPDRPVPVPPWSAGRNGGGEPDPGAGPASRPAGSGVRVVTGLGVGILVLLLLKAGPAPTLALCAVVVGLAAAEVYGVLRRAGYRPATLLGLAASVSVMVGAYLKGESALPLVATLTTVFSFLWYLAGVVRARALRNVSATVAGFMWVGFLGSYAALLLDPAAFPNRHGEAFLLGGLIAAVSYDVGGFVFGSRLGRRPLAPRVSPAKTWEGLIGGMATTFVICTVLVSQIHPWSFHDGLALGLVAAVVAPVGDLCQSLVKRDLGIKDMGTLLPGHGGLLDRVDAILFVLPATYYLIRVLGLG